MDNLRDQITACRLCEDRFAKTKTDHAPRPVFWISPNARVLIAGQAPGARVHESGIPFSDPSGDRLRDWMGVEADTFYDRSRIAILPMAFCFPGYNDKGADLPPPPICAQTWREGAMALMPDLRLILLVGGYAQKWHLGRQAGTVTDCVANWRDHGPRSFPLPHPSWRTNAWRRKNPWFEAQTLPDLRARVAKALT